MNGLLNILRSKRYTHRPCFFMAIAMGLGICLGRFGPWPWMIWSIFSGVFIILSLIKHRLSMAAIYLSLLCLGAFYYQNIYLLPSNHIGFLSYKDQKQLKAVEGIIDSDVQSKPTTFGTKQMFELELTQIYLDDKWQKAAGRILVNCYKPVTLDYGDHVSLQGTLYKAFSTPTEQFSYQQYLEDHGLFLILSVGKKKEVQVFSRHSGQWWIALSFKIRHRFKSVLAKYLEPQETNMIQAMVLGDRSFLTKDIYALFSKTGTSHILAISGMNMAIISVMVIFILKVLRFKRKLQFILTGLLLLAYAILSGWTASVIRSVLMAVVILSSFCLEYEVDTANSLGLAAIFLFLLNPMSLFDIGFQLSFVCVTIIIYLQPLVSPLIDQHIRGRISKYLVQALCVSLVAWVGISGVVAYEYDIVSPIAIIANIPIVPLADFVIALSLGLVVIGLFCPLLAWAFAGTLKAVFNFTLLLTSWFAQVPGGYFYVHQVRPWQVFLYYLVLILGIAVWKRRSP